MSKSFLCKVIDLTSFKSSLLSTISIFGVNSVVEAAIILFAFDLRFFGLVFDLDLEDDDDDDNGAVALRDADLERDLSVDVDA